MDYQRVTEARLTILYTLREFPGIRCYFAYGISCTVNIGINQSPIRCTIQSTRETFATELGFIGTLGVIHRDLVQIKQAGFARIGLFSDYDLNPYQFRLVLEYRNE